MIFYSKAETYFIEFTEKFHSEGCGRRYYILIMIERILSPAFLVVLSSKPYGTAPVIAIYVGLGVVLLSVRPYKGKRKNYRPVANCLIAVMISGILLGIAFSSDPSGALSEFGPLAILALLLIAIVYSIYALVK